MSLASLCVAQKQFSDMVFYGSDQHELTVEHKSILDSLAKRYTYYSDYSIEVIGHADSKGSKEYNKQIAERRAELVHKYLLIAGVPDDKIKISAVGADVPLDEKFKSIKNASSRRVELLCKAQMFANVDDFLDKLGPKLQSIDIDNSRDQTLTLVDGTEVFIPAHSLVYADGSGEVKGTVTVQVKESYDVMDFVSEDLMTKTQDALLQTGGMIYINAQANGKQLGIKKGELLQITYPEKIVDEDMQLYDAVPSDSGIIWSEKDGEVKFESALVNVDYNLSAILDQDAIEPVKPSIQFEKLPKIPVVPAKPVAPRLPVKPDLAKLAEKYDSKQELDAAYSKLLARYTKDSMTYQARLARYEGLQLNYDTVKPRAEAELASWEKEVTSRVKQIEEYEQQMKDFYCDTKLYNGILFVQENYGVMASADVYQGFKEIVYGELELDNVDPYQLAFGNFKKKVIRDHKVKRDYLNYNRYGRKSKFHTSIKPLLNQVEEQYMNDKLSVSVASDGDLDRYVFSVGSFGYHNVDKPIDLLPEEQMELVINDADKDTKYFVVLKDAASMVSPIMEVDKYTLDGLPRQHDMKIIGVKLVDSVPYVAVSDINTGTDAVYNLDMDFQETNLADMRMELQSLNAYAGI